MITRIVSFYVYYFSLSSFHYLTSFPAFVVIPLNYSFRRFSLTILFIRRTVLLPLEFFSVFSPLCPCNSNFLPVFECLSFFHLFLGIFLFVPRNFLLSRVHCPPLGYFADSLLNSSNNHQIQENRVITQELYIQRVAQELHNHVDVIEAILFLSSRFAKPIIHFYRTSPFRPTRFLLFSPSSTRTFFVSRRPPNFKQLSALRRQDMFAKSVVLRFRTDTRAGYPCRCVV